MATPKTTETSPSFWNLPIEKMEEALRIRKEIETMSLRLNTLLGGTSVAATPVSKPRGRKPGKPAASAPSASAAASSKGKQKPAPGKQGTGLTPEGRARLAASMKARWAARRAAGA